MDTVLNSYYYVMDRLSPRHDWQVVGVRHDEMTKNALVRFTVTIYEGWKNRENFPNYQIGVMVFHETNYENIPADIREFEPKKKYNPVLIYQGGEYK